MGIRGMSRISALGVGVTLAVSAMANVFAASATTSPGTIAQITQLVGASTSIQSLSSTAAAALPTAASDFSWSNYPTIDAESRSTCLTATACVYGDTSSSHTIVVFGDSHALMWLPAIVPAATAHNDRVVVLWQGACPPGQVNVYLPEYHYPTVCNQFRASAISIIKALKARAVVLVGASSEVKPSANGHFTNATWKTGLVKTIKMIKTATTKVVVIEDNVSFDVAVPSCLGSYPSQIQKCTVPFVNPTYPGLQVGEKDAATSTHSLYVQTKSWLCTTKCAAEIGDFIPYIDSNHVSFTYASYLSGVMGKALKPVL